MRGFLAISAVLAVLIFAASLRPCSAQDPAWYSYYAFNGGASNGTITSGTTLTLSRIGNTSSYTTTLGSGTGSYTVNLVLSDTATNVHAGDVCYLSIVWPGVSQPVVNVYDNSTAGLLLYTGSDSATGGTDTLTFVNVSGTAWQHFPKDAMSRRTLGTNVQQALSAPVNSGSGIVTGSALATATTGALGQRLLLAESIPGFAGDYVPNSGGTDNGTDNAMAVNSVIESGTVHVIFDKSFQASTLYPGNHTTLELLPGVIFHHKACNNYGLINANPTFVNISGSANTATTGTAAGYGNADITLEGGLWDMNGRNETVWSSTSTYILPSNEGSFVIHSGHYDNSFYLSGVDGFTLRNMTIADGIDFIVAIGNSRRGLIEDLTITERNLYFPGSIPWFTNSTALSPGDGIHIMGSVQDVSIKHYRRWYDSDPVGLEIGPGDGQEIKAGYNSIGTDCAIQAWYNAGPTSDINVEDYDTNGGSIALLGETAAGPVASGTTAWSGTNEYTAGQVYVPEIVSPVNHVTFSRLHFGAADATESYGGLQAHPWIDEDYTDIPPAGYPAQVNNVSIDGVDFQAGGIAQPGIGISGSGWLISHLNVEPQVATQSDVLFQITQASHVSIDNSMAVLSGTNTNYFASLSNTCDHLTLANCTGTGFAYGVLSISNTITYVNGGGNNFDGLTAMFGVAGGWNGGSYLSGQFAGMQWIGISGTGLATLTAAYRLGEAANMPRCDSGPNQFPPFQVYAGPVATGTGIYGTAALFTGTLSGTNASGYLVQAHVQMPSSFWIAVWSEAPSITSVNSGPGICGEWNNSAGSDYWNMYVSNYQARPVFEIGNSNGTTITAAPSASNVYTANTPHLIIGQYAWNGPVATGTGTVGISVDGGSFTNATSAYPINSSSTLPFVIGSAALNYSGGTYNTPGLTIWNGWIGPIYWGYGNLSNGNASTLFSETLPYPWY